MLYITEKERKTPVAGEYDVIVCGGGPAGCCAAVAAAQRGVRTLLLERNGCLGGIPTSGMVVDFIDYENKNGLVRQMVEKTYEYSEKYHAVRQEAMKFVLENMLSEANADVRFGTSVCGMIKNGDTVTGVITESKSGREAFYAKTVIDATGDGDAAALAGCGFSVGRDENNECQPLSLLCIVSAAEREKIEEYICGGRDGHFTPKEKMLELIRRGGVEPSYSQPSLFHLRDNIYYLMANHQYGVCAYNENQLSAAALSARKEIFEICRAISGNGGVWSNFNLIATAERIGVREGRRIDGMYKVTKEDMINGVRHRDGICRVRFCVDVHATNKNGAKGYADEGIHTKPYDIPLRALIAKDVKGLIVAGRCISGDFHSHASYRVSGEAGAMGEAAGVLAAAAVKNGLLPNKVKWDIVYPMFDSEFLPND